VLGVQVWQEAHSPLDATTLHTEIGDCKLEHFMNTERMEIERAQKRHMHTCEDANLIATIQPHCRSRGVNE
jgi:hypothetical protein